MISFDLQRVRNTALSACGPPSPEPVPEHVLRGGDLLDRGLRRHRARHLALAVLHARHDMRRPHSLAYPGQYNSLERRNF